MNSSKASFLVASWYYLSNIRYIDVSLKRSSFCLFIVFLVSSCGRQRVGSEKPPQLSPIVFSKNPPKEYFLSDPSCKNYSTLEQVWVPQWLSGNPEPQWELLSLEDQGLALVPGSDRVVSELLQGGHYVQACSGDKCNEMTSWRIKKAPEALCICPQSDPYPDQSLEKVASTVLYFLAQTQQHLERRTGVKFKPTKLEIMPNFESIESARNPVTNRQEETHRWIVNNLLYMYQEDGSGHAIAILPESIDYSGPKLWMLQFAVAHEFGHHIHNQIFLKNGAPVSFGGLDKGGMHILALRNTDLDLNQTTDSTIIEAQSNRYSKLIVGGAQEVANSRVNQHLLGKFHGGFSEGFADLFAYYLADQNQWGLRFHSALATRVIADVDFTRKLGQKIMTKDDFSAFVGLPMEGSRLDRPPPSVHFFGAILAHQLHGIFEYVFGEYSKEIGGRKDEWRALILLRWAEKLSERLVNKRAWDDYLLAIFQGYNLALKEVSTEVGLVLPDSWDDEFCSLVKKGFHFFECN